MSIETQNNVYIEDKIDLKQLFESLSERKLTIIFVFFITLAFGIAFAYSDSAQPKPRYGAHGIVLVRTAYESH